MNSEVFITVGIPVYNAAEYIDKCIKSVLGQTLKQIEIVVVDDRGTDDSMQIVERIASESANGDIIRIVRHEKNMGVAHARNTILREARGAYVFLMDSDDYLNPDSLEKLYRRAEETKAETVWGSTIEIQSVGGATKPHYVYPDTELTGENKLIEYECRDLHENLQHSIWNILYLNDFIRKNNLKFEPYGVFDDTIFHAKMQPLVQRAVLMHDITYNYLKRPASLSNFQFRKHFKLKEATGAMEASRVIIDHCSTLADKPYFDVKCAKVMKQAFFMICGVLKHRDSMDTPMTDNQIKQWLQHPAKLSQIMTFKRYRLANLAFFMLGKLPAGIMAATIKAIGKKKGFI